MNDNNTDILTKECFRIEEDTKLSAKGHFEASAFWSRIHGILGCTSVIITAIAGSLAFNGINSFAGSLAMYAAALTSVLTFLNPSEKKGTHLMSGNEYKEIQNKIRIFREIELVSRDNTELMITKLQNLADQRNKLNQTSPQIPRFAFKRARKGIEQGESDYSIDKGN